MPRRAPAIRPEDLVLFLVKRLRRDLDAALAKLPVRLTRLQFGVLYLLACLAPDGATITELARRSSVEPPTLVSAVHELERKKLVSKVRDAADRRRLPIRLTPAGDRLLRRARHPASALLADVRRLVGAARTKEFLRVLACLAEADR